MNDSEKELWKSIVNKISKKEIDFLYGIMDYIQRKAINKELYYLYIFAEDVKNIIENEAIDSISEKMKERNYEDIDPKHFFD